MESSADDVSRPRICITRQYANFTSPPNKLGRWRKVKFTVTNVTQKTFLAVLQRHTVAGYLVVQARRLQHIRTVPDMDPTGFYKLQPGESCTLTAKLRMKHVPAATESIVWAETLPIANFTRQLELFVTFWDCTVPTRFPITIVPVKVQIELPAFLNVRRYVLKIRTSLHDYEVAV